MLPDDTVACGVWGVVRYLGATSQVEAQRKVACDIKRQAKPLPCRWNSCVVHELVVKEIHHTMSGKGHGHGNQPQATLEANDGNADQYIRKSDLQQHNFAAPIDVRKGRVAVRDGDQDARIENLITIQPQQGGAASHQRCQANAYGDFHECVPSDVGGFCGTRLLDGGRRVQRRR